MHKVLFLAILLVCGVTHAKESSELEVTMKNMGHAFKSALKSESKTDMLEQIALFKQYLAQSQKHQFKTGLHDKSLQGLSEVLKVVEQSEHLAKQGKMVEAKQRLKKVDALRKEYHKLHEPPSVWDLIFG